MRPRKRWRKLWISSLLLKEENISLQGVKEKVFYKMQTVRKLYSLVWYFLVKGRTVIWLIERMMESSGKILFLILFLNVFKMGR